MSRWPLELHHLAATEVAALTRLFRVEFLRMAQPDEPLVDAEPRLAFVLKGFNRLGYSITSSARASKEGGISMPIRRAVPRLMTKSKRVGCSTGRSAGLVPLRIRST